MSVVSSLAACLTRVYLIADAVLINCPHMHVVFSEQHVVIIHVTHVYDYQLIRAYRKNCCLIGPAIDVSSSFHN